MKRDMTPELLTALGNTPEKYKGKKLTIKMLYDKETDPQKKEKP